MKKIDEIISKSLNLIKYDRGKTLNEQSVESPKINIFTKELFDKLDKERVEKRLKSKPPREEANIPQEDANPYILMKSVVTNKNVYIPQRTVKLPIQSDTIDYGKLGDINIGKELGKVKFGLNKITNNIFTDKTKKKYTLINTIEPKILKTISFSEPYNQEIAEQYFGSQCLKLSGNHPKYDVGYNFKLDYYIDDSGNQCTPIPYKVVSQEIVKKGEYKTSVIETDVWQLDLPKPVKLKNGSTIQKSKLKYPKGCKPIKYDFCLRFSWENLYKLGSQNEGVLEFEQSFIKPNTSTGSAGGFEPVKEIKTYRGCITDEWFPWLNTFVGYLDKTSFKSGTDSSGSKQITKCIKNETRTGVDIVEGHLKIYNLSSGVGTLYPVQSNQVQQFTLPEAIKIASGEDYNIKSKVTDYTVDLNQWFTWGSADTQKFKTDLNSNFIEYLKSVDEEKRDYEDYLKDFYGSSTNIAAGWNPFNTGKELRLDIGIEGLEDFINNDKTLTALNTKYKEIEEKYLLQKNDYFGFLAKLSEDYNSEKNKPRPNGTVTSFLENKWNEYLMSFDTMAYTTYISSPSLRSNKKQMDNIDNFRIKYLMEIFGIYDKNDFTTQLFLKQLEKQKSKLENELSDIPLTIPNDYSQYSNKGIKPVTLLDAVNRSKSDGPKNGFLYQKQTLSTNLTDITTTFNNEYKYSQIAKLEKGKEESGELSEEELETQVKMWEKYESQISEIISSTIILIGK